MSARAVNAVSVGPTAAALDAQLKSLALTDLISVCPATDQQAYAGPFGSVLVTCIFGRCPTYKVTQLQLGHGSVTTLLAPRQTLPGGCTEIIKQTATLGCEWSLDARDKKAT